MRRRGQERKSTIRSGSIPIFACSHGNFHLRRSRGLDRKFFFNPMGLPQIAALPAKTAAGYVSFYWGGAMIDRFVGAPLLRRFKPLHLLALGSIVAGVAANQFHGVRWTRGDVGDPFRWSVQFDHVRHHLYFRRSGTRSA